MRHATAAVLWSLALAYGCGGASPTPTMPTPPTPTPPTDSVAIKVYNSSSGLIRTVTKTVESGKVRVTISELNASSVDPLRLALREAHATDRLGALVAFSTSGALEVTASPGHEFDLFLMNTSSGVSYDCLDYRGERGPGGIATRYATLRRASPGDTSLPDLFTRYAPTSGPDDHFKWAAELFTKALNPFGVAFGSVTFVNAASADIVGGWANVSGMGTATAGAFAVWDGYRSYPMIPTPAHELAHAWLGAPDYYENRACWEGGGLTGLLFTGGAGQGLSRRGDDGLRYWALKADSWQ